MYVYRAPGCLCLSFVIVGVSLLLCPMDSTFFFFFTNKLVSYFACFGVPSIGSFCPTNTDNHSAAMSTYVNMIKARLAKTVSKIVSYVYAKRILVQALAERHFIYHIPPFLQFLKSTYAFIVLNYPASQSFDILG